MCWPVAESAIVRSVLVGCLAGLMGSASGCARKMVPVEGVVTLDGQPVADAQVTFILDGEDGPAPEGKTDTTGSFSVEAIPGKYKVVVFKRQVGPHPMKSALPEMYMRPTTTPFACTVPHAERLALQLTSAPNR
jgi:hypothetical protein